MSQEEKTVPLSETPEAAIPSAPEAHQESSSSPAVANVRTLQAVQLAIDTEDAVFNKAREKYMAALSTYETVSAAWFKDPTNKLLTKQLAVAEKFLAITAKSRDVSTQRLASLETERAQLQAAATASSEQKSATHKRYTPNCRLEPGSDGQIPLNLEADIETIPCAADNLVLPASTEEQKAVVRLNCTAYDFSLSYAVIGFLRNRIHGAVTVESSFHSRNNFFLDIIRIVAATGTAYSMMGITRDHSYPSSQLAPDGTIYQPEYPELVVVAEKAMGEVGAESEICDKFVFLPHYLGITRIVAIAIIGHTFKIGFIHRDPKHFEVLMTLTTGQDGNGYTLVRAAVNIGMWFRATMDRAVLHPLHFQFGVPSVTRNRHLTIYRHQFRKVLYQHGDINLQALYEFYKSIRAQPIPYFEYPVNGEGKTDSVVRLGDTALGLVMKPVGLERQPRTSDELKVFLLCILTALQDLHGRGYVHLDLRWPNVIIVAQGWWYIIDGEYVRKSGDPYPENLPIHDGAVADHAVDLTMLGKMVGALYNRDLLDDNVKALIEYLTTGDRSKRTAKGALLLVQGWCKPKPII